MVELETALSVRAKHLTSTPWRRAQGVHVAMIGDFALRLLVFRAVKSSCKRHHSSCKATQRCATRSRIRYGQLDSSARRLYAGFEGRSVSAKLLALLIGFARVVVFPCTARRSCSGERNDVEAGLDARLAQDRVLLKSCC